MTSIHSSLLADLPQTYQSVIPESYLDEMGHMNVMWYTHLFSNASMHMFGSIGVDREYFASNQRGTFALETHIRYYSEVRVGKHVCLRTRLLGRSEKRFHFMHFLVNDDDDVLATTAEFISAHIDMQVRRMTPIPQQIAREFDRLLEKHRALEWEPPVCGIMKP